MTSIRSGIDTLGSNDVRDDVINESHVRAEAIVNGHIHGKRGPFRCDKFLLDFAAVGGAQGALTLTDLDGTAATIPDNACVTRAFIEAVTTVAGVNATIKLGITGNDDMFVAATAITNGMFVAEAVTALTNELPKKTTAAVSVLATVATADLTAGKFVIHVEYTVGS